uniref:Uncharacterized protein n=1 Tax=Arundo donax TaxID=35708 RepID=A0A0A9DYS5_ARUDO
MHARGQGSKDSDRFVSSVRTTDALRDVNDAVETMDHRYNPRDKKSNQKLRRRSIPKISKTLRRRSKTNGGSMK